MRFELAFTGKIENTKDTNCLNLIIEKHHWKNINLVIIYKNHIFITRLISRHQIEYATKRRYIW